MKGEEERRAERLLIVEDEEVVALHEQVVLERYGYEVITARDAERAFKILETEDINLILMDIDLGMGKMDGIEAAKIILAAYRLPLVFLTTHIEPEVVEKTQEIAGYGYIVKDSGETVLLTSIKMAFKLHRTYMELAQKEKEHRFQGLLLESVEEAVIAADSEGIITYWNKGAEKLYKWKSEEVVGRQIREITVPEMSKDQAEQIMSAIAEGESWAGEFFVRDKNERRFFIHITNSPIYDEEGTTAGILGISFDISEKHYMEQTIRENEETFRRLFESMTVGVVYHDREGRIIRMNPAASQILGRSEDQLIGRDMHDPVWKALNEDGAELRGENFPVMRALREGKRVEHEIMGILRFDSHEPLWLSVSAIPEYLDGEDEPFRVFATFDDIGAQRALAKVHEENSRFLQTLFDSIEDLVSVQDSELRILRVNKQVRDMYGDRLALEGEKCYEVYHNIEHPCTECPSLKAMETGKPQRSLVSANPGGRRRWFELSASPVIDESGEIRRVVEYARDITERVQEKEKAQLRLQNNEILLKEVHHRMKNNMSIVAGLIGMKSDYMEEGAGKDVLVESQGRIRSMQKLYELLFPSQEYDRLDLSKYLENMLTEIRKVYADRRIAIEFSQKSMTINAERAVPIGIIVNELVVNAVKYAFPDGQKGRIEISLDRSEDGSLVLEIKDNGIGLPQNVEEKKNTGFGIKIVEAYVQQLQGTIEMKNGETGGAVFRLLFPEKYIEKRSHCS